MVRTVSRLGKLIEVPVGTAVISGMKRLPCWTISALAGLNGAAVPTGLSATAAFSTAAPCSSMTCSTRLAAIATGHANAPTTATRTRRRRPDSNANLITLR